MKRIFSITLICLLISGCGVVNQVVGIANLMQCDFSYKSINNIQLAGIELGDASSLSVNNIMKISTLLASGNSLENLPLSMTLNLNVNNPNKNQASLNELDFVVEINGMEFTKGQVNNLVSIDAGQTAVLPLKMNFDINKLAKRYSFSKVSNEISALLGLSLDKTSISVKLTPTITIGKSSLKSPQPININFTYGGK